MLVDLSKTGPRLQEAPPGWRQGMPNRDARGLDYELGPAAGHSEHLAGLDCPRLSLGTQSSLSCTVESS